MDNIKEQFINNNIKKYLGLAATTIFSSNDQEFKKKAFLEILHNYGQNEAFVDIFIYNEPTLSTFINLLDCFSEDINENNEIEFDTTISLIISLVDTKLFLKKICQYLESPAVGKIIECLAYDKHITLETQDNSIGELWRSGLLFGLDDTRKIVRNLSIVLDSFEMSPLLIESMARTFNYLFEDIGWDETLSTPIIHKYVNKLNAAIEPSHPIKLDPFTNTSITSKLCNPTLLRFVLKHDNQKPHWAPCLPIIISASDIRVKDIKLIVQLVPYQKIQPTALVMNSNASSNYDVFLAMYIMSLRNIPFNADVYRNAYKIIQIILVRFYQNNNSFDPRGRLLIIPRHLALLAWKSHQDMDYGTLKVINEFNNLILEYLKCDLDVFDILVYSPSESGNYADHSPWDLIFSNLIFGSTLKKIMVQYPNIPLRLNSVEEDRVISNLSLSSPADIPLKIHYLSTNPVFKNKFVQHIYKFVNIIPDWLDFYQNYIDEMPWKILQYINFNLNDSLLEETVDLIQTKFINFNVAETDLLAVQHLVTRCREMLIARLLVNPNVKSQITKCDTILKSSSFNKTNNPYSKIPQIIKLKMIILWWDDLIYQNPEMDFTDRIEDLTEYVLMYQDPLNSLSDTIQYIKSPDLKEFISTCQEVFDKDDQGDVTSVNLLKNHYKNLIQKHLQTSGTCLICIEAPRDIKFPCRHIACCESCVNAMPQKKCPVCRQKFSVTKCEKVFLS